MDGVQFLSQVKGGFYTSGDKGFDEIARQIAARNQRLGDRAKTVLKTQEEILQGQKTALIENTALKVAAIDASDKAIVRQLSKSKAIELALTALHAHWDPLINKATALVETLTVPFRIAQAKMIDAVAYLTSKQASLERAKEDLRRKKDELAVWRYETCMTALGVGPHKCEWLDKFEGGGTCPTLDWVKQNGGFTQSDEGTGCADGCMLDDDEVWNDPVCPTREEVRTDRRGLNHWRDDCPSFWDKLNPWANGNCKMDDHLGPASPMCPDFDDVLPKLTYKGCYDNYKPNYRKKGDDCIAWHGDDCWEDIAGMDGDDDDDYRLTSRTRFVPFEECAGYGSQNRKRYIGLEDKGEKKNPPGHAQCLVFNDDWLNDRNRVSDSLCGAPEHKGRRFGRGGGDTNYVAVYEFVNWRTQRADRLSRYESDNDDLGDCTWEGEDAGACQYAKRGLDFVGGGYGKHVPSGFNGLRDMDDLYDVPRCIGHYPKVEVVPECVKHKPRTQKLPRCVKKMPIKRNIPKRLREQFCFGSSDLSSKLNECCVKPAFQHHAEFSSGSKDHPNPAAKATWPAEYANAGVPEACLQGGVCDTCGEHKTLVNVGCHANEGLCFLAKGAAQIALDAAIGGLGAAQGVLEAGKFALEKLRVAFEAAEKLLDLAQVALAKVRAKGHTLFNREIEKQRVAQRLLDAQRRLLAVQKADLIKYVPGSHRDTIRTRDCAFVCCGHSVCARDVGALATDGRGP